ncbi:hypothetical protein [Effusibacillus consociatus]|uniref:Uncharacterized protein n=1 Tax=Effusibacillus consociatus TaxID=1117041 RepID=A0ABV9Q607_9BACL
MNNNLGWKHALGIGFEVPPIGQRHSQSGNGSYTELMHKYEIWLRDYKGLSFFQQIPFEEGLKLRTEFVLTHIEQYPEWFSNYKIEKSSTGNYICTGCQGIIDGRILETHKHNT